MTFFDSHAHYDDRRFREEYEGGTDAALSDMAAGGVSGIVNIGTNPDNSAVSLSLAHRFPFVWAAVGVHPYDTRFYPDMEKTLSEIERLSHDPRAVAIGEIGLDYHEPDADPEAQKAWFHAQMELAERRGMPVVIHDRDAHGDAMDVVRAHPNVRGVFHSYSGSAEMAKELIARGWYISFSGPITYKNARQPKEAAAVVPRDRILCETDAPYLPPVPHRGEMNRSTYLIYTVSGIADAMGLDPETVAQLTEENAKRLFKIS